LHVVVSENFSEACSYLVQTWFREVDFVVAPVESNQVVSTWAKESLLNCLILNHNFLSKDDFGHAPGRVTWHERCASNDPWNSPTSIMSAGFY